MSDPALTICVPGENGQGRIVELTASPSYRLKCVARLWLRVGPAESGRTIHLDRRSAQRLRDALDNFLTTEGADRG